MINYKVIAEEAITTINSLIENNYQTKSYQTDKKPADAELTDPCHLLANEQKRSSLPLPQNPWLFLHSYNASYDVVADNDNLGQATRSLELDNGIWKIKMSTHIKKWLLSLKSEEYSEFLIEDDQLISQKFYTTTKVSFKKAKTVSQLFNWTTKLETGSKNNDEWELPLDKLIYDRMSHLVQLRADLINNKKELNYLISYKGKHQNYQYVKAGLEKINTSFGEYTALRLDREHGDDSKFSIWLSPELNYFPIKIAQYDEDKPDIFLIIKNIE